MEDSRIQSVEQDEAADISEDEERRLRAVVDIFSRLSIACKSRSLYPADHPTAIDAVILLHAVMEDSLRNTPSVVVRVGRDNIVYEKWVVGQRMESLRNLASRIRSLHIQEISLSAGASLQDAEALVELLITGPEELDKAGGPENYMLARGVHNIAVVESEAQRVDDEDEEGQRAGVYLEPAPEDVEMIEGMAPDQIADLLKLLLDPEELARALMVLSGEEGQPLGRDGLADAAFAFLKSAAFIIEREHADRMQECLRSMAESLLFLDIEVRNLLLLKKVLPTLRDEPVSSGMLKQFNAQEIADVLSTFLPLIPELTPRAGSLLKTVGFREGEIRQALRLLHAKLVDLGQIPRSLLTSLETGTERDLREEVRLANKLPTLGEVVEILGEYRPEELDEIRLISHFDPGADMLTETTPMLLGLLKRGGNLDNPAKVVEMLLHNFWGLAMSAELDMAAAVLKETREILLTGDPAIDPFRPDLERMLDEAASEKMMQRVIQLACSRRDGVRSVEGLKRYMYELGEKGIAAVVEALGAEEDMSVRKCIIDTLTELCRDRIPLLGAYVDDERWYLVRNIVSIMARFHSPETIPYLRRTFTYPNPKVKMETIRAAGLTGGYGASELLMLGLQDEDERVRIICIRWLGRLEENRAAPRLIKMLENREPGAENLRLKKEIINSLGEMKAPESYEVLRKYQIKQKRLNRAEWQEINLAASEALRRLTAKFPHLERKR
jgi:hypothetical protein